MKAYSTKEKLPDEGIYVLANVIAPWFDSIDQYGCTWVVVKLIYGISNNERQILLNSNNEEDIKKGKIYCSADEWGNNERNYYWDAFGPNHFFGQDVLYWCEIPKIK